MNDTLHTENSNSLSFAIKTELNQISSTKGERTFSRMVGDTKGVYHFLKTKNAPTKKSTLLTTLSIHKNVSSQKESIIARSTLAKMKKDKKYDSDKAPFFTIKAKNTNTFEDVKNEVRNPELDRSNFSKRMRDYDLERPPFFTIKPKLKPDPENETEPVTNPPKDEITAPKDEIIVPPKSEESEITTAPKDETIIDDNHDLPPLDTNAPVGDVFLRFMTLMERILGQAQAEAHNLYKIVKERTDNIDILTGLIGKINATQGKIDWSKDEQMKAVLAKAKAIGVEIPDGKYTWTDEEKRYLKENIQMRKDSLEKMTQLERTDMQKFMQEASQCHQARSNTLKLLKEVMDVLIGNIRR